MNIALLTWEFKPYITGGLGRYIEHYTHYLTRDKHKIWAFSFNSGFFRGNGFLPGREESEDVVIYRPWNGFIKLLIPLSFRLMPFIYYNMASYRLLRKLFKETKIDIVSVHDWMSCPAGVLCALTTKIPVVFHVHNTEFTMTPWGKKNDRLKLISIWERLMANKAAKIIVPSDEMQALLVKNGWNSGKITVIQHGYEDKLNADPNMQSAGHTLSELRSQLEIAPNDIVLLFAGRFVHAKGIYNLIQAMAPVVEAYPNVKLVLAGTGENKKIDSLICRLNLTENIHAYYRFLDTESVIRHYMMADICIFPSLYEPFGLVALEAMSLGKPVILGSGFPKLFGGAPGNPTALFVESNQPQKIAEGIMSLLNNPERAARMGEAAQSFARNNFDWNKTFEETVKVYRQATGTW